MTPMYAYYPQQIDGEYWVVMDNGCGEPPSEVLGEVGSAPDYPFPSLRAAWGAAERYAKENSDGHEYTTLDVVRLGAPAQAVWVSLWNPSRCARYDLADLEDRAPEAQKEK